MPWNSCDAHNLKQTSTVQDLSLKFCSSKKVMALSVHLLLIQIYVYVSEMLLLVHMHFVGGCVQQMPLDLITYCLACGLTQSVREHTAVLLFSATCQSMLRIDREAEDSQRHRLPLCLLQHVGPGAALFPRLSCQIEHLPVRLLRRDRARGRSGGCEK